MLHPSHAVTHPLLLAHSHRPCHQDRAESGALATKPITRLRLPNRRPVAACQLAVVVGDTAPSQPSMPPLPREKICVLWDLDNIPVALPAQLPLVGRRLMHAVQQLLLLEAGSTQQAAAAAPPQQLAGTPAVPLLDCHITAYANGQTLARLAASSGAAEESAATVAAHALALIGGRLVAVPVRRCGGVWVVR